MSPEFSKTVSFYSIFASSVGVLSFFFFFLRFLEAILCVNQRIGSRFTEIGVQGNLTVSAISTDMAIQDHSYAPDSSMILPGGNTVSSDAAEQTITVEGHVLKMRKPYTITKQRERWAEEEHKKFLEALKLYGRAWRKIEDHVGTKTAVQIRSHAQKFFSKVVRESNNSNSGSIKATEIPPPRPKRKPMYPYPRKLVIPVNKDMPLQEQSAMATSPNLSFDQEHQSPTSVMCEFPSEAIGSEDSGTLVGSSSPISFHDSMSSQDDPVVQGNISQSEEPVSVKLELSPSPFTMEGSLEATSHKTLKLFGKTMLLDDPEKAAASSISLDQQAATKFIDFAVVNTEKSLDHTSAVHYLNSNPQPMEVGPSAPVPYRPFCGGMTFPLFPLDNINSMKEEDEDKETCITWPSLAVGSVNAPGDCQMSQNTETQFHEYSIELTHIQQSLAHISQPKLSANLKRSSSEKYTRVFMPYKRSLFEKGTQSSTMAAALNNDLLKTRLCLA